MISVQCQSWIREHGQRYSNRAFLWAVLFGLQFIATPSMLAQTFTVLHTFAGKGDGANPSAGVIRDTKGNIYGTTFYGGAFDYGTVFKLDPKGKKTILHNFAGGDGLFPDSDLIRDASGNLYGTTYWGGTPEGGGCRHGCGTVFKVDRRGKETVLYAFTGGADGGTPQSPVLQDAAGNLYGTTYYGGDLSCGGGGFGCGVVFKVDKSGKETVLHTFTGGADGANPSAGLIRDAQGNLYGTAEYGGTGYCGVVFKLSKTGRETVLYSFTGPPDGANPLGGLVRDNDGNLYSTTIFGGISCYTGCGTVFKVDTTGKESVLYSFSGGSDGMSPLAGLVMDRLGNLFGTTLSGGSLAGSCRDQGGCGVVFELDTAGVETVLHSFTKGKDGAFPSSDLIRDAAGNLYGTTNGGGSSNCAGGCGVVFKITP